MLFHGAFKLNPVQSFTRIQKPDNSAQDIKKNHQAFIKISAQILGFAFHAHKARTLLRRLSRTSYIGSKHTVEILQKENGQKVIQKKVFEIPIFSNNTMVLKGGSSDFVSHLSADNLDSSDFEKFYKISEKVLRDGQTQSIQY